MIARNAEYHQWEWPNLRHLKLEIIYSAGWSHLTEWLQKIGPQLHSLLLSGSSYLIPLNPTIWELCPSLEYVGLPPPSTLWTIPPVNHPVRALRLGLSRLSPSDECIYCRVKHPPPMIAPLSMRKLASARISTLVFRLSWKLLVEDDTERMATALLCLLKQSKMHNISPVDREWMSFEDWVVSELEMYKRSGRHIQRYTRAW